MSFNFLFRSIIIDQVVLYFDVLTMYQVFLCLRFDDMRLSISYGFYIKNILKEYSNFVKSFNYALLSIYVYAMNDTKGFVQDLREFNYTVQRPKNTLTSRI